MSEEAWWHVLDVNLASTFRGCKMAVPLMRSGGGGAIVNLASINSIRGNNRMVAYSASKGGVMALTMAATSPTTSASTASARARSTRR